MNIRPWATAILLSLPAAYGQEAKLEFRLSPADARTFKMDRTDKYSSEFGDANGPFKDVGGIVVTPQGLKDLEVRMDRHLTGYGPDYHELNTLLHIEFFINEKGNGFGVVHKRPVPEAEKVEAPEPVEDDRPYEHVELCAAAKMAVLTGNTELMKALLQAGYRINETIDLEYEQTALHTAVISDSARMVRMLLENGADPELRDKFRKRPIDHAFEHGRTGICEALARPERVDPLLAGFPEAVFDEIFHRGPDPSKGPVFLSFNESEPSEELLRYFRRLWRDVRPVSAMEEVPMEQGKTAYRDAKTKDHGILMQIEFSKEGDNTVVWSRREASGPALAGGGYKGKISKKYGWWLRHDESSWDE